MQQIVLGDRSFPYYLGHTCMDGFVTGLADAGADLFIVVTDDTVLSLHGERLLPGLARHAGVVVLSQPAGEAMKSLSCLAGHLETAIAAGATRRSVVVTFGGGVPGNLGGLVAALLFRGIRLFHVPTTTVSAMDSVISHKQAINSSQGKNHLGTYHMPDAVFTDVSLLQTLPGTALRSGMGEATKNCLAIRPQALPDLRKRLAEGDFAATEVLLWLLEESILAKTTVTATDTREQRRGLVLEYGHTVGHAVELCHQRVAGAEAISHGEAVAFGMIVAARVSAALGKLSPADVAVHEEMVTLLGAPTRLPDGVSVGEVMRVVALDNKRGYLSLQPGEVAMVLLERLGCPLGSPDLPLVAVSAGVIAGVLADLLPQPAHSHADKGKAGQMSDDALTTQARAIWAEALGQDIADDTDFFEAGGHSFAAMSIIAKLDEALAAKIPLRTLFDFPQFDEFVEALSGALNHG